MMCVEIVTDLIIVGRRSYDNEVCVSVGFYSIESGGQVKFLLSEITFDVIILCADASDLICHSDV